MAMQNLKDPAALQGATVVGSDRDKLGKVEEVYLDNDTSEPEWAAVKTGMFGGQVSLVPLAQADFDGSQLTVPYDKNQLKDAPHHDPGSELSQDDEAELYRHYGMGYSDRSSDTGLPAGTAVADDTIGDDRDQIGEAGVQGRDTSGPTTDEAMTRSEEQLHVGTQQQESGKARLRKYVVTENVTQTVPVSHEEVRLEREPITEANRGQAMTGGDITEEEHEVTLHEERPVVSKETVPVERVRLDTETVTENQQVNEEVRKEQIETDTSDTDRPAGGKKR